MADIMVQEKIDVELSKIGLKDCFAVGYGSQHDVQKQNGLDRVAISESILSLLKKSKYA
jgi:deoxyxylulose-5-phosphate synthase